MLTYYNNVVSLRLIIQVIYPDKLVRQVAQVSIM